jgi:hypothetical protein
VGYPYAPAPYWAGPAAPVAAAGDEKSFLENELAYLEQQLSSVKSRLSELETASGQE